MRSKWVDVMSYISVALFLVSAVRVAAGLDAASPLYWIAGVLCLFVIAVRLLPPRRRA